MAGYWEALRSFSPSLRRLLMASALVTTVFFGILAVVQNLFLLRLGYDARFIGLALGIGQLVWAAAALPAALLSRRIGLRNAMMLGYVIAALAIALLLTVQNLPPESWSRWIVGCQALMMLGVALFTVNLAPFVMAVTHERERRYAFGVFQAIFPATGFVGSMVAGTLPGLFARSLGYTLDDPEPYRLTMTLAPALLLLALLPLSGADPGRIVVPNVQLERPDRAPVWPLVVFGAVVFLHSFGEGSARLLFNVYLNAGLDVPPARIGAIMGVAQLLPIAAALSAPLLIGRMGTGRAFVAAILVLSVFLFPLAAFPGVWVAGLSFMGCITALAVLATVRDLFGQELVTPRWRTSSAGALIIGLALGLSSAGVIGGYLIDTVGFGAMYLTAAVMALLSALLLTAFLRMRRMPAPVETAESTPV
jgi:MFS family permease